MRKDRQHLLRVERPVVEFAELIAALRHQRGRTGWLELPAAESAAAPAPLPATLAAAADRGVLRAVAVGGGRAVAVKPLGGAPVLRDLLREHFRGCALVLVQGAVAAPLLEPAAGGWRVIPAAGGGGGRYTTEELLAALRRPRPWDGEAAG